MEKTKSIYARKISLTILVIAAVIALIVLVPKNQEVVAKVNSDKITATEFNNKVDQTLLVLKSFGGNVELPDEQISKVRDDVLQGLISVALVAQYAKEKNISVSDEELNEERDLIASSSGGEEQLKAQLEQFGISETQFENDVRNGLLQKKSIENFTDPALIEVTEEEVAQTYDSLISEAKETGTLEQIPPYEDAKNYLALQMKNQKILANSEAFIESLRSSATIEILI